MTVHLVNLTNRMMMKGPFRELIPLSGQHVKIQIPEGRKVVRVQLLRAGIQPEYTDTSGTVELIVPEILDLEVVAVDLE